MVYTSSYSANARSDFDFGLLYQAALIANNTYAGGSKIFGKYPGKKVWTAIPGQTNVRYVLLTNNQTRVQVIAVRGTIDSVNQRLNRDTRGVRDEKTGILMHSGFRTVAKTIYDDVRPRLKQKYTIYLTGHSLGGVVAAILGIYLQEDSLKLGGIATFGQPKFTNAAGARAYRNLPIVRVINQNDVVAVLPDTTKSGEQTFVHVGPSINLLSGPYWAYIPEDQAYTLSQRSFRRFLAQVSIPDHKMARYINNLRLKQKEAREVLFKDRERYVVRRQLGTGIETAPPVKPRYNFNHHD